MTHFAMIPAAIVCAGLALTTFAQTEEAATATAAAAAGAQTEAGQKDLADVVHELERRIEKIEQQLAVRSEQESLGRGLVAFGPIVANLKEERFNRYIRVSIVLAVDEKETSVVRDAMANIKPKLNDWLYAYLADKAIADVTGRQNQSVLRKDIQTGFNSQFRSAGYAVSAEAVLFNDITVQ